MNSLRFETRQIHAGQESPLRDSGSRAVPIYATAAYVFENCHQAEDRFALKETGNIYSRLTNPSNAAFETRMASLEGGVAALATASGAAALYYALINIAGAGDHLICARSIYGGSYSLIKHTLRDFGIESTFVNIRDLESVRDAFRPNTKALFVESIENPNAGIPDLRALSELAHHQGVALIVDNTIATPYLIRPIEHGADVVVHSATKFIGGHGAAIGGVVVDSGQFDWVKSGRYPGLTQPSPGYHGLVFADGMGAQAYIGKMRVTLMRDTGAVLSPFHSFLFLQGLETLSLRIRRHVDNALEIVEYLRNHPKVKGVNHPSLRSHPDHTQYQGYFPTGAASVFTFELAGGQKAAFDFIHGLKLFSLVANIADTKSLVIHPATTTHAQLDSLTQAESGISPGTIRLSIGLEDVRDLLEDLERALEGVDL